MAESRTTGNNSLNGSKYPTWKAQFKMMLMKEGLWKIVTGEETEPMDEGQRAIFAIEGIEPNTSK